ncbi:hypothetical protein MIR68_007499 [Amoeboaphelidium protococcarum]|nr:hypothetical protein MIR68_007499 [Amoeboaphelidium protococcarum]KAI3644273.1 hypothetical protein MP228_010437 [Amoeboaphelidium protococcarum]
MNSTNGLSINNYQAPSGKRRASTDKENDSRGKKDWKCGICHGWHHRQNKKKHLEYCQKKVEEKKKNEQVANKFVSHFKPQSNVQSPCQPPTDTTVVASAIVSASSDKVWQKRANTGWVVKHCDEIDAAIKRTGSRGAQCNATKSPSAPCDCQPAQPLLWRDLWKHPPNPLLASLDIHPDDFIKESVFFWVPEVFFFRLGLRHMPCPVHGVVDGKVTHAGWSSVGPRKVVGLGQSYYVMYKRYKCSLCNKEFRGLDDRITQYLPAHIAAQLPCVLLDNSILDKGLVMFLDRQIMKGMSFEGVVDLLNEMFHTDYQQKHLAYTSAAVYMRKKISSAVRFQNPGLIEPFGDFDDLSQYNGVIPSSKALKKFYLKSQSDQYDLKNAQIVATTGNVLSGDHTFKAAKVPISKSQQIFEGLYSLVNEFGQVIGYWLVAGKSLKDLKAEFSDLRARYEMKGEAGPSAFYTDLCCTERETLQQYLPSLFTEKDSQQQRVLLDVWHFMERYPVSKKSHMYPIFAAMLRDAIFICSDDDLAAIKSVLLKRGVNQDLQQLLKRSYLVSNNRVRRMIPRADVLSGRVDDVVQIFRQADSEFIHDGVMKKHLLNMKHVQEGCLSDPDGVPLYMEIKSGSDDTFKQYKCFRGSSQQEGYHMNLYNAFQARSISPELFDVMLLDFVYRRNLTASQQCGFVPVHHVFNPSLLLQLQQIYHDNQSLFAKVQCQEFGIVDVSEFSKSIKFGCKKYLDGQRALDELEDSDVMCEDLEQSMAVVPEDPSFEYGLDSVTSDDYKMFSNIKSASIMMQKFSINSIPRPVQSEQELSLYLQLYDILSVGHEHQEKKVDFNHMAKLWNSAILEKIGNCEDECQLKELQSVYSFKAGSHLKAFQDVMEKKLRAKYALEPYKAQLSQLQAHLTDSSKVNIPFQMRGESSKVGLNSQQSLPSTDDTTALRLSPCNQHLSVETQTFLRCGDCSCVNIQMAPSHNDQLQTDNLQSLLDGVNLESIFDPLPELGHNDFGGSDPLLPLQDSLDANGLDQLAHTQYPTRGDDDAVLDQQAHTQYEAREGRPLTYITEEIIQTENGPIAQQFSVNLTEMLKQCDAQSVYTSENGFSSELDLHSNLKDAAISQVCSVCWKARLMVNCNIYTNGHGGKSCEAARILSKEQVQYRRSTYKKVSKRYERQRKASAS